MAPRIRLAETEDAAALSALGRATFTGAFGFLYKPEDLSLFFDKNHSVDVYAQRLSDPARRVWVLEGDEKILLGYASVGPCGLPVPNMPERAGELERFYIRHGHQGGGYGGRMLELALAWLDKQYEYTYLSVFYANHGAQRLYKRFGFRIIHEYRYMVGNQADPEYIMERVRPDSAPDEH